MWNEFDSLMDPGMVPRATPPGQGGNEFAPLTDPRLTQFMNTAKNVATGFAPQGPRPMPMGQMTPAAPLPQWSAASSAPSQMLNRPPPPQAQQWGGGRPMPQQNPGAPRQMPQQAPMVRALRGQ